MSKKKKARRKVPARKWVVRNATILVVALAVGVLIGVGWWKASHRQLQPSSAAAIEAPTNDHQQNRAEQPREVRTQPSEFAQLKGKWVRTDGG